MIVQLLILFLVIAVANSLQDEIRFRWGRLFKHLFKEGSRAEQWFNPSKSWTNKWFGKSRLADLVFSTLLVWTTDFWHLLKFIIVNSIFVGVLLLSNLNWSLLENIAAIAGLNVIWGIFFETSTGILGALSDKYIK